MISMSDGFTGDIRPTLLLLLAAAAFVLLIACSNVANLALARAAFRQREMAVRTALGASPSRLLCQVLSENLLLAVLSAIVGTLVAFCGTRILNGLIPFQAVRRFHDFVLDARVLGFAVVISLLSAIVASAAPAIRFARLKDLMQSAGRGSAGGPRASRLAGLLVISEVALAVTLLCSAVLLIRSSMYLEGMPRGFNPKNVVTMQIWLPRAKYSSANHVANFYHEVLQRIQALPGVESAGAINFPPLAVQYTTVNFTVDGQTPSSPDEVPNARCSVVSDEYFRTMNVPLLSGRTFTNHDADETHGVAVISASMARHFWPGSSPAGGPARCPACWPGRRRTPRRAGGRRAAPGR